MREFTIITDTGCDLRNDILTRMNIEVVPLACHFEDGSDCSSDSIEDFYDRMRSGHVAKTTAINPDTFVSVFRRWLEAGKDIVYLSFSSALSTTYNSANIARDELAEEFPDRKILTVDTLCASAGQGLLVYLAARRAELCDTPEELCAYVENLRLHICHWFTVDDLVYLKRGGRVSSATAFLGSVLGIKPILHVDNEGYLVGVSKVRGRKAAVAALAERFGEAVPFLLGHTVFISHSDCIEDANALAALIRERYCIRVELITDIGPVIGAHSGPGTLALFFAGNAR